MNDWFVVYECDGEKNVMTVSSEFATTKEKALEEALYSFNAFAPFPGKILLVTQDMNILDNYDLIDIDEIELPVFMHNPKTIIINRRKLH